MVVTKDTNTIHQFTVVYFFRKIFTGTKIIDYCNNVNQYRRYFVSTQEGSIESNNKSGVIKKQTADMSEPDPKKMKTNIEHVEPDQSLDWDSFNFSLNGVDTEYIWLDTIDVGTGSQNEYTFSSSPESCIKKMQPIPLYPSSTVLNYGQSLFEGLKAFRRQDGSIVIFRPHQNARRLKDGAERLLLPYVPENVFIDAVDYVVRSNAKFVPPVGKGALYLRPLLFGSGKGLGVKPSTQATFCIYASPVGNYFKGNLKCIKLQAVKGIARAAPGGSGSVKASGNYAPPFMVQAQVKKRGYDEALFLDAVRGEYIEEAGASNFFAVFPNKTIVTPSLDSKTILPGITRASIIELARSELDYDVQERNLSIGELKDASEAFCCGTGASVTPIGCVSYLGDEGVVDPELEFIFGDGIRPGVLTQKLYDLLLGIQNGTLGSDICDKYKHWIHDVKP